VEITDNQSKGKEGEEQAYQYLIQNQYNILERNWRFGHLEVDVIASDKDRIIFCEVKARSSQTFGPPEINVTKQKQRNLIQAAHHYVCKKGINLEVRFDIITIVFKPKLQINHIPNAFTARW